MRASSGLFLYLTIVAAAAGPADWPSFRGAGALGLAPDAATVAAWDVAASQNILWKAPVPGLGHSSPVIWGDRLFITTAVNQTKTASLKVGLYGDPESAEDNDAQQWQVLCFDKKTGQALWQQTAHAGPPRLKRHPKATHANCSMAVDGSNAVAFFGSEGLYCYDLEGHLRWQKDLGTLRASPSVYNDHLDTNQWSLEWGFASSPIIHNGRVFVQCDVVPKGFVAAFDVSDGRELWRTERDDTATWSTPGILDGPRPELLVNGWRHIGGYDLETGAEVWRLSGGGDCPVPTPIVWRDLIFIMSAHGPRSPIYAVRAGASGDISLTAGATNNAQIAWSWLKGAAYMQTPVIVGGDLYSCNMEGIVSCFDARTGRRFYKERLGSGGDGFTASPVASKDKIYFTSEQGNVFVVRPGVEFRVIATNHIGEVCMATPAISGDALYYRTAGHLIAIGQSH